MHIIPDFGKYALYIWPCYLATFSVFAWFTLQTHKQRKLRKQTAARNNTLEHNEE
jgi:heme exporter protein CcmD